MHACVSVRRDVCERCMSSLPAWPQTKIRIIFRSNENLPHTSIDMSPLHASRTTLYRCSHWSRSARTLLAGSFTIAARSNPAKTCEIERSATNLQRLVQWRARYYTSKCTCRLPPLSRCVDAFKKHSDTGTRTRVACVKGKHANTYTISEEQKQLRADA